MTIVRRKMRSRRHIGGLPPTAPPFSSPPESHPVSSPSLSYQLPLSTTTSLYSCHPSRHTSVPYLQNRMASPMSTHTTSPSPPSSTPVASFTSSTYSSSLTSSRPSSSPSSSSSSSSWGKSSSWWSGVMFSRMNAGLLMLGLILTSASAAQGSCKFPADWEGSWFLSGLGDSGPVVITRHNISHRGECVTLGKANRYLVKETEDCFRCMVIIKRHANVIQYKESYCVAEKDLRNLCLAITSDAMLLSMFRVGAEPVSCPFHGPFTFTYSKGYGECATPVSQVDSCAEDSRLRFRHQACADVAGSESYVEKLECLGSWKDGSTHYLVGKVDHMHANGDEDRYRCFIYARNRDSDSPTWRVSQSADASCQGLSSANEGSKTMKLTKVNHGGRKCHFPKWLAAHKHWHTLDYSQSYYVYHHNTSLRISNGTAPPENPEVRGHTDLRLVCHEYQDKHEPRNNKNRKDEDEPRGHRHQDTEGEVFVTFVAHVTVGCESGFQCVRLYRRDHHVVEVQKGDLAFSPKEACTPHYWSPARTNLTTLVAAQATTRDCGPLGQYRVPDSHQTMPHACPDPPRPHSYSHFTVGCSTDDTLQLHPRCASESISIYHCHGLWEAEGVTYVVASPESRPSGSPRRMCFAYTHHGTPTTTSSPGSLTSSGGNSGGSGGAAMDMAEVMISMTARYDVCSPVPVNAHIALNATLSGRCREASSQSSSGMGVPAAAWCLLPTLLLLLLHHTLEACQLSSTRSHAKSSSL
ncbi:uncharacterized protein LOC143032868 isoform X2 [Oratosquilla oratoria]|uniref:uncharacterized protein LOC143032868 isoform X2 n=1 Tax=Oratosquilla oratoria TaxID=337810 RepID=UPI003F7664C8